jgi:hypothetical protein
MLLWGHRNIDPLVLGLNIKDYPDVTEKTGHHAQNGSDGAANNGVLAPNQHQNNAAQGVDGTNTATGAPASTGVHNNASAV